ncbi:hypothetical protein SLEP1_g20499 [Rubroshorea leprosula]|uniref:Uncharacterized protein n=1 Tax=Rubroshorea leprosula TaxID=152421 RepID=A0AAV5J2Y8_9ROSI|nr:hypothetical protein SLEP1_g20499 [Rubroshorea leprosula]
MLWTLQTPYKAFAQAADAVTINYVSRLIDFTGPVDDWGPYFKFFKMKELQLSDPILFPSSVLFISRLSVIPRSPNRSSPLKQKAQSEFGRSFVFGLNVVLKIFEPSLVATANFLERTVAWRPDKSGSECPN